MTKEEAEKIATGILDGMYFSNSLPQIILRLVALFPQHADVFKAKYHAEFGDIYPLEDYEC